MKKTIFVHLIIKPMNLHEYQSKKILSSHNVRVQRGYIAAPLSIWENIKKIMPGTKVTISLKDDRNYYLSNEEQYWSVKEIAIEGQKNLYQGNYENCKKDLEALLLDILKGQSLSDVPLGVFLSSGIDSSLICSLLVNSSTEPVNSFTISFPDNNQGELGFDEGPSAKMIASHLGTNHNEVALSSSDLIKIIPSLSNIYSEPFADSSQIPTFILSKFAVMLILELTVTVRGFSLPVTSPDHPVN